MTTRAKTTAGKTGASPADSVTGKKKGSQGRKSTPSKKPASSKAGQKKSTSSKKVPVKNQKATTGKRKSSGKKTTRRRKKKSVLKLSPTPTIYDLHPFRKYIEHFVYNIYSGRKEDYHKTIKDEDKGPVKVPKTKLKKVIRNQADRLIVKRKLSWHIRHNLAPDQRALMWDYLANHGLPESIDLETNYMDPMIWRIIATPEQRRRIEGYYLLGKPIPEIAEDINKTSKFVFLTVEQITNYLYFLWNTDSDGRVSVFPISLFIEKILSIRNDIYGENFYRVKLRDHETKNKAKIIANKSIKNKNKKHKIVERDMEYMRSVFSDTKDTIKCMVHAPYYESDSAEKYIPWALVAPSRDIESKPDDVIPPMSSYEIPIQIGNNTINTVDIEEGLKYITNDNITISSRMERMIEGLVMKAEKYFNSGMLEEYSKFLRKMLAPTAAVASMLDVKIDAKGANKLIDHENVAEGDSSDYKKSNEIEVFQDRKERHSRLLGNGKKKKSGDTVAELALPKSDQGDGQNKNA